MRNHARWCTSRPRPCSAWPGARSPPVTCCLRKRAQRRVQQPVHWVRAPLFARAQKAVQMLQMASVRVLDLAAQDRQAVRADLDASLRDVGIAFVHMSDAQLDAKDR